MPVPDLDERRRAFKADHRDVETVRRVIAYAIKEAANHWVNGRKRSDETPTLILLIKQAHGRDVVDVA